MLSENMTFIIHVIVYGQTVINSLLLQFEFICCQMATMPAYGYKACVK